MKLPIEGSIDTGALEQQLNRATRQNDEALASIDALSKQVRTLAAALEAVISKQEPEAPAVERPPESFMQMEIGGAIYTPLMLTPWVDGTKVGQSDQINGFSLMTFDHPGHKRWVVQYANRLGRTADGYGALASDPYTVKFILDGEVIHTDSRETHGPHQEWSFEIGKRKPIWSADDLERMGHIPYHTPPIHKKHDVSRQPWPIVDATHKAKIEPFDPAKPLHDGPLVHWMPAQGGHPEVHWTTELGKLAAYDDLTQAEIDILLENIRVSAESFAVFSCFSVDKDTPTKPANFSKSYYLESSSNAVLSAGTALAWSRTAPVEGEDYECSLDTPHLACPMWEHYLLTGDPYHLRGLQMAVNVGLHLSIAPNWRRFGLDRMGMVVARQESRGYAKCLMLLWRALETAPIGNYEWLHSRPYYAKAMQDNADQSVHLAKLPNAKFGRMRRDYFDTMPVGVDDLSHMDVQALWAVGWMHFKSVYDFSALYQAYSQAWIEAYNVFGPPLNQLIPDSRSPMYRDLYAAGTLPQSFEEAGQWVRSKNPSAIFGPGSNYVTQIWEEERFEGVFTHLAQMGDDRFMPIAKDFRNARLRAVECVLSRNPNSEQRGEDYCLGFERGGNPISPDWSFALESPAT